MPPKTQKHGESVVRKAQGRANMVTVTLQNIFSNTKRGEAWFVLADNSGRRGLPIFVGSLNPLLVAMELRKKSSRPLTFSFIASILKAVGADLTEVRVVELVRNTFKAVACVRAKGLEHRLDARPSDAVVLAACMGRPIYVAEELMAVAGKPLGAEGRPPDLPRGFVGQRWLWSDHSGLSKPSKLQMASALRRALALANAAKRRKVQ